MNSLNDFYPLLGTQDTKKKLQIGIDLINYLGNPKNSLECEDLNSFIDGVISWLGSSNFKVCMNGLEMLAYFVDRLGEDFRPYISSVLPSTVDRLGDNKDQVRELAQVLIQKLICPVSTPQHIFDRLIPAFSHKSWRVREEVMICLQRTLDDYGANSLSLSKFVPYIVKLLSDPTSQVRDSALNTLVDIYRHVGERVRLDLTKKFNIQPARLQSIMAKFDEARDSGLLLPTAASGLPSITSVADHGQTGEDEPDKAISKTSIKRASSAPPVRRAIFSVNKPPSAAASKRKRTSSFRGSSSSSAGAVDEDTFMKQFEDVPKLQIFSPKDLDDILNRCRETLADPNNDWEKRVEVMKRIRAVVLSGAAEYDELFSHLRSLEHPFQLSVKDLRSQVVREVCITIAYLSQQLGQKMDHFAEALLPNLINLIPNSAKIMSTAGVVAIRFIIQYTHASRLIPIITTNMVCKSKEIRRACCEFLSQLLHTWPTHTLERHIAILQDAIRKGISDADPEARASARKAYWGFADHFADQAESLLNSLDNSKQRMLQGQMSLSNSSSNNSLNNSSKISRSRASSAGGSTENLSRVPSFSARRTAIPMLTSPKSDTNSSRLANGSLIPTPLRSNSAIDLNAAQRARARATYAATARLKVGSGASLPRPTKKPLTEHSTSSAITSPERSGRSRSRVGVSQSQPSSRSGSPSSRLSYATYNTHAAESSVSASRPRRRSGVVHSTGTSRETSPTRNIYIGHERRLSGSCPQKRSRSLIGAGAPERLPLSSQTGKGTQVMAQRILTQSKEAEVAMADALVSPLDHIIPKGSIRRRYDAFGNESDDSETSSVCSERSYGSLGRPIDDVAEIISNLASQHWADRKEGLVGLQNLVNSNRMLTATELKKVTDIFTKMFMDPHTKVFSIFLDTLHDLIATHKLDLNDWLHVLLTRLFNKLGADLLGSVQVKVQRTLDTIRDSFPLDHQFSVLMRFLIDQTQTPNLKVKVAVLNYLHSLCQVMSPSDFNVTVDSQAAIAKVINWMSDPKSTEIRRAAQSVVIALFNLNTPEFTKLLSQLPKSCQDNATKLLHNHLRRASSDDSPLKASPIPMAIRLQSPNTTLTRTRPLRPLEYDDTENLNPEEIYNSLRKTTAEIQNYSFDSLDHGFTKERKERFDRDTTSQDSGISQMSAADGRMDILEESPENGSPTRRKEYNAALYQEKTGRNGYERQNFFDPDSDLLNSDLKQEQPMSILSILSELAHLNKRNDERKTALGHLSKLAKDGSSGIWDENFKSILRVLLETLSDNDGSIRAISLRVLCEMLRRQAVRFHGYAELTILKILEAHRDTEKDVVRAAEICAATLAGALPAEQCVRVLNPIILTGDYPVNQAAIKMLTKVIEQQPKPLVLQFIGDIMPGLIKAYDNPESSVRKAAVFCMVAAHLAVGDALQPYLAELNGSKLKLLNLYIKRAQTQGTSTTSTSSPTSPLHSSSSSQDPSPRP